MDNEEIPYRTSVTVGPDRPASTRDENEYSTLIEVNKMLIQAIQDLYKDFNAFDWSEQVANLKAEVAGRQIAYDILMPLQQQVQSAIQDVASNYEER